jgi:penicillin-binding protein 1A
MAVRRTTPRGSKKGPLRRGRSLARTPTSWWHSLGKMWRLSLRWRGIWYAAGVGFGVLLAMVLGVWAMALMGAPSIDDLWLPTPASSVTIYDRRGEVLAVYGDKSAPWMAYASLPQRVVDAVLTTEDRRFFEHGGVDPWGILRAAWRNFRQGGVREGGSTISQQLAKMLFLSEDRSWRRKLQELYIALVLEHRFTKKQLLESYLNRAYMGQGIHGFPAAARYYFGRPLGELGLSEVALLAGMLKAPLRYSPLWHPERAGLRSFQILSSMVERGMLPASALEDAKHQPVRVTARLFGRRGYATDYAFAMAERWLEAHHGNAWLIGQQWHVRTTLDKRWRSVRPGWTAWLDAHTASGAESAFVVLHKDGSVAWLEGGRDYERSPYNRAVEARRHAGSAFKVFVYAAALEAGWGPDSRIEDAPVQWGAWAPRNMDRRYLGEMTLRRAFALSRNTPAVRLTKEVGVGAVRLMAHRMGLEGDFSSHPSMSLGAVPVDLLGLTGSYGTVSRGGVMRRPWVLISVASGSGSRVMVPHDPGKVVLSSAVAASLDGMLRGVTEGGTGRLVHQHWPGAVAGKTGTTQSHRDAWFIGYDAEWILGVWLGYDRGTSQGTLTGSEAANAWGVLRKAYGSP